MPTCLRAGLLLALLLGSATAAAGAQSGLPGAERRALLEYAFTRLDGGAEPWHLGSLELSRRSPGGTLLARGSLARRFDRTGTQLEVEAYPRLTPRTYAFVGAGFSADELFPELRLGAELFTALAPGWEASAGARWLDFRTREVTLLTGSVGAYPGNWYLAARPFLSLDDDGGSSLSGTVLARRYLRDADEYVSLRLGGGEAPAEVFTAAELERVGSTRVAVEGKTRLARGASLLASLGWEREELPADRERRRVTAGVGVETRF
jgi:YaiO family outer membrane protein